MNTKFSDLIENTPAASLLVGTLASSDAEGRESSAAIIEGRPEGFRMLAHFLQAMADSVESGDARDSGWHLSLSPEDLPALVTREVRSLSLGCSPADDFSISDQDA